LLTTMRSFLTILALFVPLMLWIYLLFARGMFWSVRRNLQLQSEVALLVKRVAVIIPARNEADVIAQSIASLLDQRCQPPIHIFVVDDNSRDDTARVAQEVATRSGNQTALTIIAGRALPEGWSGKLWALHQGIAVALETSPDFLLLTDADILHASDSIANLIGFAEAEGYDLASLMVKLHCRTLAERLLIPAFVFFFFKLYPPAWVSNLRRSTAAAAGGCILIRPAALAAAGGIAAIRGEIIDDCALARRVKRGGGKIWLGLSSSTSSLRAYGTFTDIARMISRTAFNQLRHSAVFLIAALTGLVFTYLLPVGLVFAPHRSAIFFGLASLALMTVAYLPIVRLYRLNPLWALSLPLAALFYAGATVQSALNFWRGRGGEWKGRVQDPIAN
jgi:hopene-associated glycosyltransferase HpnB